MWSHYSEEIQVNQEQCQRLFKVILNRAVGETLKPAKIQEHFPQ